METEKTNTQTLLVELKEIKSENRQLKEIIQTGQEELMQLAVMMESLHFIVMQIKSEKEDPARIVMESVSQGLGIPILSLMHHEKYQLKQHYHSTWLPIGRSKAVKAIIEDPVARARLVMLFFLKYYLGHTPGTLKMIFSWYTFRQEDNIRKWWAGVLSPQTPQDRLLRNETIKCQGIISQKINLTVFI
mgnify:CR=1 FL=1